MYACICVHIHNSWYSCMHIYIHLQICTYTADIHYLTYIHTPKSHSYNLFPDYWWWGTFVCKADCVWGTFVCKADCVWLGRKFLEAKGKSRSTTFMQCEKRNFQTAQNGVFPSVAITAGQTQSALCMQHAAKPYITTYPKNWHTCVQFLSRPPVKSRWLLRRGCSWGYSWGCHGSLFSHGLGECEKL
jgi:hypothetical protein